MTTRLATILRYALGVVAVLLTVTTGRAATPSFDSFDTNDFRVVKTTAPWKILSNTANTTNNFTNVVVNYINSTIINTNTIITNVNTTIVNTNTTIVNQGDTIINTNVTQTFSFTTNIIDNSLTIFTNVLEITTNSITIYTNTYVTNATIFINGTNVAAINPTIGRLPYKSGTNTFDDSSMYFIDTNTTGTATLEVTDLANGGVVVSLLSGKVTNIVNGTGALTNDGAGNLGWATFLSADLWTNTAGVLHPVDLTTISLGLGSTNIFLRWDATKENLSIGENSGYSTNFPGGNTAIGSFSGNVISSGYNNVLLGNYTGLKITSGYQNTALGMSALAKLVLGHDNTAVGTASLGNATNIFNTAVGSYALNHTTTGIGNTALGYAAGMSNVVGSYNTFIGMSADGYGTSTTNGIAIGYNTFVTNNNEIVIGNTNNTATYLPALLTLGAGSTNGQITFGSGGTNVLYRSGSDLVYTNGQTDSSVGVYLDFKDGAAHTGKIGLAGIDTHITAGASGSVWIAPNNLSSGSYAFLTSGLVPDTSGKVLGSQANPWSGFSIDGTGYVYGFNTFGTNYSRLAAHHTGTNGIGAGIVFESQANGLAGSPRPFVFTNAPVQLPWFTSLQKTNLAEVANGMLIYQTDNTPGIRAYVNGAWVILQTAADP